jgi:hypothetical protein
MWASVLGFLIFLLAVQNSPLAALQIGLLSRDPGKAVAKTDNVKVFLGNQAFSAEWSSSHR